MNVRQRLFLSFGLLFAIAFGFTIWLEGHMTGHDVKEREKAVQELVLELSEKRRQNFERFIADSIAFELARADVVLEGIRSYSLQAVQFAPTKSNLDKGTWIESAALLLGNKFLELAQNTNEGKLSSLIVLAPSLETASRVPAGDDFTWVFLQGGGPYVGVTITTVSTESLLGDLVQTEEVVATNPEAYILFPWEFFLLPDEEFPKLPSEQVQERLRNVALTLPWSEQYEVSLKEFFQSLDKTRADIARLFAQQGSSKEAMHKWLEGHVQAHIDEGTTSQKVSSESVNADDASLDESARDVLRHHYQAQLMRNTEQFLTWALAALNEIGSFGPTPLSERAPVGMATFEDAQAQGTALRASSVFFEKPLFDDLRYYQTKELTNAIAVIQSPDGKRIFLGNATQLAVGKKGESKYGYLTVGINAEESLGLLALTANQAVCVVHDGKIFSALSGEGKPLSQEMQRSLDISAMLQKKTGFFPCGDHSCFFMHLVPFEGVDLHYLLLTTEEKEFAIVRQFEEGVLQLIETIIHNMRVAGIIGLALVLVLLEYFSRRISRPISGLALATQEVVKGSLEGVNIPEAPTASEKDEIAVLCRSFKQMVKGLKEKEQVKGILNKVVSHEIASEILKGEIHLGGEEKKATMFFADIRRFTPLTQNMAPKEVIDLLNSCMTRISQVIDRYGGVIDKYVGDEAMALYGVPIPSEKSALAAVESALDIVQALHMWNKERRTQGLPSVEVGFGVHTGNVLVGNMGAENRLNYTVIGRNVNFAARLCSLAQGMEILISEQTLNEKGVKETIAVELVPDVSLKGFDGTFVLYRVISRR